jgi:hypothetical protein
LTVDSLPASLVYFLCFLTSSACAFLLGRGYFESRARLLLWSATCFGFLALSNLLLVVDLIVLPGRDLSIPRTLLALAGIGTLLFSFVWNLEEDA